MIEIRITSMSMARSKASFPRAVATFGLDIAGLIELSSLTLTRMDDDVLIVSSPSSHGGDRRRFVYFRDRRRLWEVKMAAVRAYLAMGGTDVPEWAVRDAHAAGKQQSAEAA